MCLGMKLEYSSLNMSHPYPSHAKIERMEETLWTKRKKHVQSSYDVKSLDKLEMSVINSRMELYKISYTLLHRYVIKYVALNGAGHFYCPQRV